MKTIAALCLYFLSACPALCAASEDQVRAIAKKYDAYLCYRFSNWSESPNAEDWTITLCFAAELPMGEAKVISAHPSGMPMAKKGIAEIRTRGAATPRVIELGANEANQIMCSIGFSGYFATDSSDARPAVLDGRGLVGERLYRDEYTARQRSAKESLSCEWLTDYLENLRNRG